MKKLVKLPQEHLARKILRLEYLNNSLIKKQRDLTPEINEQKGHKLANSFIKQSPERKNEYIKYLRKEMKFLRDQIMEVKALQ